MSEKIEEAKGDVEFFLPWVTERAEVPLTVLVGKSGLGLVFLGKKIHLILVTISFKSTCLKRELKMWA